MTERDHTSRPEVVNGSRLAAAAQTILKDLPENADDFSWAAERLRQEPNPDYEIIAMINYEAGLHETTKETTYEDIALPSGMRIDIEDPERYGNIGTRSGSLVSLTGTIQKELAPGIQLSFIKGYAIMRDYNGVDQFVSVNISESGNAFAIPKESEE